jgi:hypothetical protein
MNNQSNFLPKLSITIPEKEKPSKSSFEKKILKNVASPKRVSIDSKCLELALITLGISKNEFNSMTICEFSNIDVSDDYTKVISIDILEYYKTNNFLFQ